MPALGATSAQMSRDRMARLQHSPACWPVTVMKPKLRTEAPLACASRSITMTRLPRRTAASAWARPQMPAPTTARSKERSVIRCRSSSVKLPERGEVAGQCPLLETLAPGHHAVQTLQPEQPGARIVGAVDEFVRVLVEVEQDRRQPGEMDIFQPVGPHHLKVATTPTAGRTAVPYAGCVYRESRNSNGPRRASRPASGRRTTGEGLRPSQLRGGTRPVSSNSVGRTSMDSVKADTDCPRPASDATRGSRTISGIWAD